MLGTLALTIGVAVSVWFGHRDRPLLVGFALGALALFSLQIVLGALVATAGTSAWLEGLHVALGALSLATSVVTCALAFRGGVGSLRHLNWRDYVTLTKPRIVGLLVVTTIPAMMLAGAGDSFALADPRDCPGRLA